MKNSCKKVAGCLTTLGYERNLAMTQGTANQDSLYEEVSVNFGPALSRLARRYQRRIDELNQMQKEQG